jgi:DNA polymerase-3 subunit epsilon
MKKITFYDTETTDMPNWKIPSGDESQPHLVSLCAIQCNEETEEIIQRVDLIIKSEGWESKPEAFETHGITKEFSIEVGVSESSAVAFLLDLCSESIRVSHNRTFDQRIIRIALKRYFDQQSIDQWASKDDHLCTMLSGKDAMGVKKWPSLSESYKYFTGEDLKGGHNATIDAKACMKIYFAMKKAGHSFR